ncbi:hypothetical protein LBMAG37_03150 [Anaerolineae bacterium]|nr:ATP synthase subunit b, sodium ion specific [Anaerolineaceae bacterium]GBL37040.1 ATP synthase subunit b, sodium ion specific [Anaerolineaceae bacterium]GDX67161.1 hypothetical protein LBMAG37_03150 [Anaerolineae bacterium]
MAALGLNLGYLLVQMFSFLVMFVVLRAWVYGPVLELLAARREKISKSLEDARKAEELREHTEAESSKILAAARAERATIVADATYQAEKRAADIIRGAEKEREELLTAANLEAESKVQGALEELRPQIAAIAIAAAGRIVQGALDDARQHALIDSFFSGVREGKVTILEGEALSGAAAVVTSAITLNDPEKEKIKKALADKLGGSAKVSFRVDPSILGGIVIRVGDHEVNGSARQTLAQLQESLR